MGLFYLDTGKERKNMDEPSRDEMYEILSRIGMGHLYSNFEENRITPAEIEMLTAEEFSSLGVVTIGDRARIKQSCKDHLREKSLETPVLSKFRQLRSGSSMTKKRKLTKDTRKIYFGWKHMVVSGQYRLVHPSRGGGQHMMDISKSLSLTELRNLLTSTYFPDGICLSSNLRLEQVEVNLVNFTGHPLPETVADEEFSVGVYCDSRKTNPIRIYLQTKLLTDMTTSARETADQPLIAQNLQATPQQQYPQSIPQQQNHDSTLQQQNSQSTPQQQNPQSAQQQQHHHSTPQQQNPQSIPQQQNPHSTPQQQKPQSIRQQQYHHSTLQQQNSQSTPQQQNPQSAQQQQHHHSTQQQQDPHSTPQQQNPKSIPQQQNPQFTLQQQDPQSSLQQQHHHSTPQQQNPQSIPQQQNPQSTSQQQYPQSTQQQQDVLTSQQQQDQHSTPQKQNPNSTPQQQNPQSTQQQQDIQSTQQQQDLQSTLQQQYHHSTQQQQNPQSTTQQQYHHSTLQQQDPQSTQQQHYHHSTEQQQNTQSTLQLEYHHSTPQQQEPQSTPHQQNPQSTQEQQDPQSTLQQQNPQSTSQLEYHHSTLQQQEPQSTPHQQNPQSTQEQQDPQSTLQQQNPQSTSQLEYHHSTPQQQEPQSTQEQEDPQSIPQQQNPQCTPQQQNPQSTLQQQNPQSTSQLEYHHSTPQQQDPHCTSQQQYHHSTQQQQNPQSSLQQQDVQSTPQQQDPQYILQQQNHQSTLQQQDPQSTSQQQYHHSTPQLEDPQSTSQQQDPQLTLQQRDPQSTLQQQDPQHTQFDFIDSGTPTIQFRLRRNLSLSQRHLIRPRTSCNRGTTSEFIEVEDSDDEELQRALLESVEYTQLNDGTEKVLSLSDVLKEFQAKLNSDDKQEIIVSRRHVLESAYRALRRHFDCTCKLFVKFSGELGLDLGGPKREFFRLVLQELCNSSLFEGGDFSKFFRHDIKKLEEKQYFLSGKLCAMSVLHDGPGIHFLQLHLSRLMLEMETDLSSFDLDLLQDETVKVILKQLRDADTTDKGERFLCQHGDWLLEQGYQCPWRLAWEERNKVLESLIRQFIFYRSSPEIVQFCNGMDEIFGFWTLMKSNPDTFLPLLCHKPAPLDKESFMELFDIDWSETGSNRRAFEEDTIYSWEIFLQDIEEKAVDVTFEEVLVFITGTDKIPPCGFPSKIHIEFYTDEERCNRLPFVSTCSLTLSLPRRKDDPDVLQGLLLRALKESYGFGKV